MKFLSVKRYAPDWTQFLTLETVEQATPAIAPPAAPPATATPSKQGTGPLPADHEDSATEKAVRVISKVMVGVRPAWKTAPTMPADVAP
jgi:hypothetical protein